MSASKCLKPARRETNGAREDYDFGEGGENDKLSALWGSSRLPRPRGMINYRSTCYLNSVLQALTFTPEIWKSVMKSDHMAICKAENFCTVCTLIRHFRKLTEESNDFINPVEFIDNISDISSCLVSGLQNDAAECMTGFINKLVDDDMSVGEKFQSKVRKDFLCTSCGHKKTTVETETSVILQPAATLFKSLENNSHDIITDYTCPGCKKMVTLNVIRRFEQTPDVLVTQFNRCLTDFGSKHRSFISYPCALNLSPFCVTKSKNKEMYDLCSVIIHNGETIGSGHYLCLSKMPNGEWLKLNDTRIKECTTTFVLTQPGTYVCVYQKRGIANGNMEDNLTGPSGDVFVPRPPIFHTHSADERMDLSDEPPQKRHWRHEPPSKVKSSKKRRREENGSYEVMCKKHHHHSSHKVQIFTHESDAQHHKKKKKKRHRHNSLRHHRRDAKHLENEKYSCSPELTSRLPRACFPNPFSTHYIQQESPSQLGQHLMDQEEIEPVTHHPIKHIYIPPPFKPPEKPRPIPTHSSHPTFQQPRCSMSGKILKRKAEETADDLFEPKVPKIMAEVVVKSVVEEVAMMQQHEEVLRPHLRSQESELMGQVQRYDIPQMQVSEPITQGQHCIVRPDVEECLFMPQVSAINHEPSVVFFNGCYYYYFQ